MNSEIKITIVTICYNAESLIERTIKSVISQEYPNIEYIIIDGNSTDKTMEIVNKYSPYIDSITSEEDRGIADAFNKGIRNASGDRICFLNAGDYFISPTVLSKVANDTLNHSDTDVIFYKMIYGQRNITPPNLYRDNAEMIWENMAIPHQACFCKRDLFGRVGIFDITFKIRMDYDFFARCVKQNVSYEYIPEIITVYDDTGVSSNPKNAYIYLHEGILVKETYKFAISLKERLRCLKWWFVCTILKK